MSHRLKDVFNINDLDLAKICKSFGFDKPPFTNLNIRPPTSHMRRNHEKGTKKENFYNKRNEGSNKNTQYTY